MYGVVLLVALGSGAEAPAWAAHIDDQGSKYVNHGHELYRHRRCGSCGGCYGSCGGCYGGCYASCGCSGWVGRGYSCGGWGCSCGGGCGGMAYVAGGSPGYAVMPAGTMSSGMASLSYPYGMAAAGTTGSYYGGSAPAMLRVTLPADARVLIDNTPTQSMGTTRTFASPPLDPGKEYQYVVTAETDREGKTIKRTKEVTVRAGQQAEVHFDLSGTDTPEK